MFQSSGPTVQPGGPSGLYISTPHSVRSASNTGANCGLAVDPLATTQVFQDGLHVRKNGKVSLRCLSLACVLQIVTKLGL